MIDGETVNVKVGMDRELWYWKHGKGQIILAWPTEAKKFVEDHCKLEATQHELNWIDYLLNPPESTRRKFEKGLVIGK
jgi:hypothetical protein